MSIVDEHVHAMHHVVHLCPLFIHSNPDMREKRTFRVYPRTQTYRFKRTLCCKPKNTTKIRTTTVTTIPDTIGEIVVEVSVF